MPLFTPTARPSQGLYHPTLSSYYPHLVSLRQFLGTQIIHSDSSLATLLSTTAHGIDGEQDIEGSSIVKEEELDGLLDTTLVASDQVMEEDSGAKMSPGEMYLTQQEMVDRALVTIARRPGKFNELSVLCSGFRRSDAFQGLAPNTQRLGLDSHQKNSLVVVLVQGKGWVDLHNRLGTDVMIHLFTSPHLSLFLGLLNNCYTQLSGKPLYLVEPMIKVKERELKRKRQEDKEREREERRCKRRKQRVAAAEESVLVDEAVPGSSTRNATKVMDDKEVFKRPPVYVEIVRNRMFYGKWGYRENKRLPGVGLPVGHIMNNLEPPVKIRKLPSSPEELSQIPRGHHDPQWAARTFLRYLFPREHGLHNVFSSPPGTGGPNGESSWPDAGKDRYGHWRVELGKAGGYRNYECRKDEIEAAIAIKEARTPTRMKKGEGMEMARRVIARHRKCDYRRIRDAFCPARAKNSELPANTQGAAACAISPGQVSRFVLAVCRFVFPESFWGSEDNNQHIRKQVITFIRARRYETLSIHQIMQGFKVNDCAWLAAGPTGGKVPMDEALKRRDLVHELIYWFFDGFLVPLLKTTFYITETSETKYRTTYFRQDDWATLCKPMLEHLTSTVYYKLDEGRQRVLRKQKPSTATIRLIPKPNGMRPICNLGKKQRVLAESSGAVLVKPSINDKLADAHQALTYEKERHPELLSSSLFSLYDIYGRLKSYKAQLKDRHGDIPKLFFVKMDIKAAFDSLNQEGLLLVASEILRQNEDYVSKKHVQMLPLSGRAPFLWRKQAYPESHERNFVSDSRDLSQKVQNAVFVDQAEQNVQRRKDIVKELFEHITMTHIRFGKDYYLQDTGIPQGSKVSSLLCSYFFGHMEKRRYKFTSSEDCLLMRIIDDFLFITPDKAKAELFLKQMNKGSSSYGCHVALSKSLCNFVSEQSLPIPMSEVGQPFPYCGTLIDPKSLDLKIDVTRSYKNHIREILSVKSTRSQGSNFAAWLKRMLENHNHIIYNDTALSSPETVWSNIYTNFLLTAMKAVHYLDQLESKLRMNYQFICNSIDRAIELTANANRAHLKSHVGKQYRAECTISSNVFTWIAKHAFQRIFAQRGEAWEPVHTAMKEDLRRARYKSIRRDRRLVKTIGVTWSAVAKVPF